MALRFVFVLLLSVYSFNFGMAIPAFQCGPNAAFKTCGSACAPTCAHPKPPDACTQQCITGCFCKEGFLKNANGECVRPQECQAPEVSQCKENEMFLTCGTACPATCAKPHPSPMCTKNCVIGCFCKSGYLKNEHGVCIEAATCGVSAENVMPIPPKVCSDDNEEFRQCKGCDGTCKKPNPLCPRICIPGCACKEGHVRSENGKCIQTRECATETKPVEEKCGQNEEYRQCKGCDGTCDKPNPLCPRICISGCACKQGHIRSVTGKCVRPQGECSPELKPIRQICHENEIFKACGTACPATCANPHPSPACTRNCVIGCFCKEGYLKNAQGVCVPASKCDAPTPVNMAMIETPIKSVVEGKCGSDREIYVDCGSQLDCMASCAIKLPFMIHGYPQVPAKCLERMCTPGCVCMKPYIRHSSGRCVEPEECEHKNPFTTTPSH